MKTLGCKVDDKTFDKLCNEAKTQNKSVSDLLRDFISTGLKNVVNQR